jgi:hypothetical protein
MQNIRFQQTSLCSGLLQIKTRSIFRSRGTKPDCNTCYLPRKEFVYKVRLHTSYSTVKKVFLTTYNEAVFVTIPKNFVYVCMLNLQRNFYYNRKFVAKLLGLIHKTLSRILKFFLIVCHTKLNFLHNIL